MKLINNLVLLSSLFFSPFVFSSETLSEAVHARSIESVRTAIMEEDEKLLISEEKQPYRADLLRKAALEGDYDILKLLLQSGFKGEVNFKLLAKEGETVLHAAARGGGKNCVKLLLFAGSEIDTVDSRGRTAFYVAAENQMFDVMDFLMDEEAHIFLQDKISQRTALDILKSYQSQKKFHKGEKGTLDDMVAKLSLRKSSYDTFFQAAKEGKRDTLRLAITEGINIGQRDETGLTAFHYAARYGRFKVVEFLIRSQMNVDVKTYAPERTPLTQAVFYGHRDIVKILLENGAKATVHDAKIARDKGHREIAEMIRDHLPARKRMLVRI